jgi:putative heme-binding domain-containing protein
MKNLTVVGNDFRINVFSITFLSFLFLLNNRYITSADDVFSAGVRTTEPLAPEEQMRAFDVPPGFEMELVVAEPQIAKPMNMAFDARGRLWVSDTLEYPFAVPVEKEGRDSIKILTDTNGDGDYDHVSTFAKGLNIPIGLYPYKNGVLAWSIPNIWWFEDTDGDGVADRKEKRYGPLGWERDTHGMNASFTRGFDGWLYATHGFNNTTTMHGSDGSSINMHSGNTYRIRLDGRRVESYTFGQVNPFGMCLDPLGHLYTADCHSAPVYQLLRGAYYPSFGKPHDGLGFAPSLMTHAHGSTAISGIVFYDDDLWPMEHRENVFIGNVMTSRLNRDMLLANGSSRTAHEMPDLVKSSDPWFRPVNLQLGPDGALYIADFYNRIIGHYEVPLKHPQRDRKRGRIWKLSYNGMPGKMGGTHGLTDFTKLNLDELIDQLGHPNISRRILVTHYLVDQVGKRAGKRLRRQWNDGKLRKWRQRVHALWVMEGLAVARNDILGDAVHDVDMEVRTHAMRVLAEREEWSSQQRNWVTLALQDEDPNVQRAAADALGQHGSVKHVGPLLKARDNAPINDPQWLHGMRLSLRNQLRDEASWEKLSKGNLSRRESDLLADVALAVSNQGGAEFLVNHAISYGLGELSKGMVVQHASRYASVKSLHRMATFIEKQHSDEPSLQFEMFHAMRLGLEARGESLFPSMLAWGSRLVERIIVVPGLEDDTWTFHPVPGLGNSEIPWFIESRTSTDGDTESHFLCSLPPGGETRTGIIRSPGFNAPSALSFYVAGHDGHPSQDAKRKNRVRLLDLKTGHVLRETFAPRHDVAQLVRWNLDGWQNRMVYLEFVDADDGNSFAWLAVGRLKPSVVELPSGLPSPSSEWRISAIELAGELGLQSVMPRLRGWIEADISDSALTEAAANAFTQIRGPMPGDRLISLLIRNELPLSARMRIRNAILSDRSDEQKRIMEDLLDMLTLEDQRILVNAMSGHSDSARLVARWIQAGKISIQTLRSIKVFEQIKAVLDDANVIDLEQRLKDLPPLNQAVQDLIDQRRESFDLTSVDRLKGKALFEQACAVCHRIENVGALVGPQLDGLRSRGMDRVIEDILAPNRNVDPAFKISLFKMESGKVYTGIFRREEGGVLVLVDVAGQEWRIAKNDIISQRTIQASLMPDNFGDLLNEKDLGDLVGFLVNPL